MRNVVAALTSALAILALAVYLTAPVAAKPTIVAISKPAHHPMVMGMVKGDPRKAHVKLTFRDAHGRTVAVRHPHVAPSGAWRASIPPHAVKVLVVVSDDGRTVRAVEAIVPGRTLRLTTAFAVRPTGLVPGLFPY